MLGVKTVKLTVREVGVRFDLVNSGHDASLLKDRGKVMGLEVRDPDGAHQALIHKTFHCTPGRHDVAPVEHRKRPVDQEQVQVVQLQVLQ